MTKLLPFVLTRLSAGRSYSNRTGFFCSFYALVKFCHTFPKSTAKCARNQIWRSQTTPWVLCAIVRGHTAVELSTHVTVLYLFKCVLLYPVTSKCGAVCAMCCESSDKAHAGEQHLSTYKMRCNETRIMQRRRLTAK